MFRKVLTEGPKISLYYIFSFKKFPPKTFRQRMQFNQACSNVLPSVWKYFVHGTKKFPKRSNWILPQNYSGDVKTRFNNIAKKLRLRSKKSPAKEQKISQNH